MQCPKCGKSGFVNIGSNRFCSNCGAKLTGSSSGGPSTTMADITTMHKPLDLRPKTPDTPAPVGPSTTPGASTAQPAAQLHGRQVSGTGVLDLRATPAPAQPGTVIQPAVAEVPVELPTPTPVPEPAPIAIPASQPITPAPVESMPEVILPPVAPVAAPGPTPSAIPQSPLIKKFPPHPGVAPTVPDVSAIAATHVDAMSAQAANAPAPPGPPQSPALQQALAAAKQSTTIPSVLKIGTAVVAIGAMAGIVWLQNSPKLAFHTAATKAGIDASLPTYIPSSYHQNGPVTASAGELTLQFSSPDASSIKITQQQTNWDSNSLRDNYVSHQTDSFSAVQGQGLTIFLYGDQADWINHGVWYQITGATRLSRSELLKVAYGL